MLPERKFSYPALRWRETQHEHIIMDEQAKIREIPIRTGIHPELRKGLLVQLRETAGDQTRCCMNNTKQYRIYAKYSYSICLLIVIVIVIIVLWYNNNIWIWVGNLGTAIMDYLYLRYGMYLRLDSGKFVYAANSRRSTCPTPSTNRRT